MQTGENEQGLRKIIDLTRMIGIAILLFHFYYRCYGAFLEWHLRSVITDRILQNIEKSGLFSSFHKPKLIALGLLVISLMGAKGKKDEKINYKSAFIYVLAGLIIYFFSRVYFLYTIK